MADRSDDYREYYKARPPLEVGAKIVGLWHRRMLQVIAERIPGFAGLSVLEVGTGWGYFARACREKGVAYSGLEMNADQAAALRAEGLDVVAGSIPPFPEGKPAQVLYLSHVLEHASGFPQAKEMLNACHARLDPGGHVVIVCPDLLSWKEEFWGADWSHGFPTTLRRLEQIVAEAGFVLRDSRHHTAGLMNPALVFLATSLFRLIPVHALDAVLKPLTGRPLCYSFMGIFGWRQLLVIAEKPAAGPTAADR